MNFGTVSDMAGVRPKKRFGQHFLKDEQLAGKIVASLDPPDSCEKVVEVGPGMGVLSDFLFKRTEFETFLIEIDRESYRLPEKEVPPQTGAYCQC